MLPGAPSLLTSSGGGGARRTFTPMTTTVKSTRPAVRYVRNAVVDKVVDGDTVALLVDLGWQLHAKYSCRILLEPDVGIDTPEKGHPEYLDAVGAAKALLRPGTKVVTESLKMIDKYGGRFDGRLWLPDGQEFAALMIASGYAKAWREGTPKPYPRAGQLA